MFRRLMQAVAVLSCLIPVVAVAGSYDSNGYQNMNCQIGCSSGTINPLAVTPTDKGGTIAVGGTAQNAVASNASRKGGWCQNPVNATEDLYVSFTGSATVGGAGNQADLAPGQSVGFYQNGTIIQTAVSVNAATGTHRFNCVETQ